MNNIDEMADSQNKKRAGSECLSYKPDLLAANHKMRSAT